MKITDDIKAIQRHVGVQDDGIIGPMTVRAIRLALRHCKPAEKVDEPLTLQIAVEAGDALFDKRTLKNIATLEPKAQKKFTSFMAEAKAIAASMGCEYVMISGNRTYPEQNALYAKGRTTKGPKVTNARGGYSNHNFAIAGDNGVFRDGKYLDGSKSPKDRALAMRVHAAVAAIDHKHGIVWGGDWKRFKDFPHFEVKTGLSMAQRRARLKAGKAILA